MNSENMNSESLARTPNGVPPLSGEVRKGSRGLRNNNPLNIRRDGQAWQGLSAVQTDKAFCQFKSMAYGFRAAFVTLHTYMTKHGLGTIGQIIKRWAPPSENNTSAYVRAVCELSHTDKDKPLSWSDEEVMLCVVQAMAWVENGVLIGKEGSMRQGYEMARKSIMLRKQAK